jgi:Tol biopolymer transport system component/predicted Ser/Thr protein kinase
MSLGAGEKLGPYEILGPIGAGGMGEVYKARDTRLDRIVAVKVSKTEFSERFEREARAIATLNHPHICQLYDVGPNYLVMEYLEGAPLKGSLPLDQTLKYAAQICDALDAAHKKNITHRDLKPANILVTKAGVKLLDFGLAKVGPAIQAGEGTMTMALTGKNEILGTFQYMSPEQLNSQDAGPPSDIFSFGLVLYEMLTGKRAFDGSTPASVIAAILERPAPSVADVAPPALDRALKRCLEKDPENRWQSARDLKVELEWIGNASESGTNAPAALRTKARFGSLAWGVALVALAFAGWGWWRAPQPAPLQPLVRLDLDLQADPPGVQGGGSVILSPDGRRLFYDSKARLFTRRLDQTEATELPGTEAVYAPFFSPDGQWIAFQAQGKLKKISVEGGEAIALCDATKLTGGSWGEDGNIIANLTGASGGLSRISSSGGAPTPVTQPAQGEIAHSYPQILPGGKAVLFEVGAPSRARIDIVSLADRRRKTLVQDGTYARYLGTSTDAGYLIYVNQGTLFAVSFDLKALELRGTAVRVLERVAYSSQNFVWFDVSRTGTLVYRSGGPVEAQDVIQWMDASGRTQPLLAKPGLYTRNRLSPDGQRLAVERTEGSNTDIWIYDWQRDTMSRLTFGGFNGGPVWSPDGHYIAFGTLSGMFWTRADGAGKPQSLTKGKNIQVPTSFTPDGRRLAFMELNSQSGADLWTLPIESEDTGLRPGKPEQFLATPFYEALPSFSPDGKWLAYYSNDSGVFEVYVRAFPDKGSKWQVSNSGGMYPLWSHNGRELFYRTEDNRIMVASYTAKGDSFVADKPRLWSEKHIADLGQRMNYDLAPDGKRVVAVMPAEISEAQTAQSRVTLVLNFLDEVRRRVPTDK